MNMNEYRYELIIIIIGEKKYQEAVAASQPAAARLAVSLLALYSLLGRTGLLG